MATTLKHRRGTDAEAAALTGGAGELYVSTESNTVFLHDGTTQGGHELAMATGVTLDGVTDNGNTTTNTITVGDFTANGNAVITGNLTVEGSTTTISTSQLDIEDKNITVAKGSANKTAASGGGLTVDLGSDGFATLNYNSVTDGFAFDKDLYIGSAKVLTTADEGTGNGLDADTLDNNEGTYYLDYTNFTNSTSVSPTFNGLTLNDTANVHSIIPETDNTYDLGTAAKTFRHVYVGPGSLYVNGKQVITDDAGTITVTTDTDQMLQFKTSGVGNIQLVTGASGVISVGSTLQIASGSNITDSAGTAVAFGDSINMNGNRVYGLAVPSNNDDAATKLYVDSQVGGISTSSISDGNSNVTVTDSGTGVVAVNVDGAAALTVTADGVTILGNLTVDGSTSTVAFADNILTLNADATGSATENAGIAVERGDDTTVGLRWEEGNNVWQFTNDGATYYPMPTDTDDLVEAANLYYTDARVRAAVSAGGDITYNGSTGEFSVTTYKSADFDTDLATKDTADLTEGSNLYYTDARARGALSVSGDLTYNSTTGEFGYVESDDLDSVTGRGATTTNAVTFGNITTTGYIGGPAVFTIDPAAIGDNTGKVVIAGDLQVDGTTTTINSTIVEIDDLAMTVAGDAANKAAATGGGLIVNLGSDGTASMAYNGTNDSFKFNKDLYVNSAKVLTTANEGAGNGIDADTLDGQEGAYYAVATHDHDTDYLGIHATADNAALLNNQAASYYAVATHDHDSDYLGITAKAADSNLLDAHDSSYFAVAGSTYTETEVDNLLDDKLDASAYTAADVLAKIKTVDGIGSGLDADLLDGHSSAYFAVAANTDTSGEVDAKIAALVDSSPAALDTLNELAAALGDDPNFATTVNNNIAAKLDETEYTAADVLTKLKTVDTDTSGLNANTLQGHDASYFAITGHNHDTAYLGINANAVSATKWATARIFDITGDVTGSGVSFDGTGNVTFNATVVNDSHTHDSRYYTETETDSLLGDKLDSSEYTAADVLTKLKTVDTDTSGLNANTLQGHDASYFATASLTDTSVEVDAKIAALVDNSPAALNTLNELAAALGDDPNFATTVSNDIGLKLDESAYTAADVLAKIKTVDGSGSGLDADTLDTHSASYFATATHNHDTTYLGINANAASATKLATARTFDIVGDVTGTAVSFDGSANVSFTATVVNDSHSHSNYILNNAADTHSGSLTPSVNDSLTLGNASYKYAGVYATTFYGTSTTAKYADLAEKYTVAGSAVVGDVIVISQSDDFDCEIAGSMASQAVLGVVSENPAFKMNEDLEGGMYIALKGRVPCKVTGFVAKGDPLVTSANGMAMSINNPAISAEEKAMPGVVFGKALASSEGGETTIEIIVL